MPRFPNGQIPGNMLAVLDSGNGEHLLPLATASRWYAFRRDVHAETGVWLYITPGKNGYRSYAVQVDTRNWACSIGNCNQAAYPGSSSHGGTWNGGDAAALDIGNYWAVPWAVFKRLAEKWGFLVGAITKAVAGIDEPWHIIDRNPYSAVVVPMAYGADGIWRLAPDPLPIDVQEDDVIVIEIDFGPKGKHLALLGNGLFAHLNAADTPATVADITGQDRIYGFGAGFLPNLLDMYGCDPHIWDIRTVAGKANQFVVVDPMKSGADQVAPGNTWTAEKALRAAVAGIKVPQPDTAPIVAAVKEALAGAHAASAAEIAVAVNDEAAKRLAG